MKSRPVVTVGAWKHDPSNVISSIILHAIEAAMVQRIFQYICPNSARISILVWCGAGVEDNFTENYRS